MNALIPRKERTSRVRRGLCVGETEFLATRLAQSVDYMALHNWPIKLVRSQTSNIMKSATSSRSLNEQDCNASHENTDQASHRRRSSLRIENQRTDSKSNVTKSSENGAGSLRSLSSHAAPSQCTSADSHVDTDEMSIL